MSDPRGRGVSIYLFVDANHAGNVVTRSLHTGIIMFIRNTSFFGSVGDRTLSRRIRLEACWLHLGFSII